MIFTAYPLKGVNDIEFGMTAEMIYQRMSGRLEIGDFRATSKNHPTYYYSDIPVFFYFDDDGQLEGIEFCRGADVELGGVNFLEMKVKDAISAFTMLDPSSDIYDEGVRSRMLSMAIWCPNIGDSLVEEPVETLMLATRGYFNNTIFTDV